MNAGLGWARSKDESQRLIEIYRAGEAALRRELAEFIRKRDYRFQEERTTTSEADAYARANASARGRPAGIGQADQERPEIEGGRTMIGELPLGRFSTWQDTSANGTSARVGRYADGLAASPSSWERGRFSTGQEMHPNKAANARVGSFGDVGGR